MRLPGEVSTIRTFTRPDKPNSRNNPHASPNNSVTNIFSLAPKELTNSAIWAWIFHGLCEEGNIFEPRRKIAEKMLKHDENPNPQSD
jgi:hypothetical protein